MVGMLCTRAKASTAAPTTRWRPPCRQKDARSRVSACLGLGYDVPSTCDRVNRDPEVLLVKDARTNWVFSASGGLTNSDALLINYLASRYAR